MLVDWTGRIFRLLPAIPGKEFVTRTVLAPAIRGRGHACVVAMHNPGGGKLLCHLDDWIPWNVWLHGNYAVEGGFESFVVGRAANADVVFDVGANIGYYTVQFARVARGTVHAFEPMSHQFGILRRNVDLNELDNVEARRIVVSDDAAVHRVFFAGADNTGSSSLEIPSDRFEDVESIPLDEYCEVEGIDRIDVVKIDVEGHELSVLRGMQRLLDEGRVRDLFLEINEGTLREAGTSAAELCESLARSGYRPYSIRSGAPSEYRIGDSESLVYFTRSPEDPT